MISLEKVLAELKSERLNEIVAEESNNYCLVEGNNYCLVESSNYCLFNDAQPVNGITPETPTQPDDQGLNQAPINHCLF